jgi:AraC-like DNA-binding protein
MQCDTKACGTVAESRSDYIYKCHAGLTEAIVPIFVETKIIGYLFFGQIFCYPSHKEGWNNIKKCCKSYNIDMSLLEKITSGLPIIPEEYIASASHLLKAVAAYLSIDHLVMVVKSDLAVQINDYIYAHLNEPLGVKNICSNFKIGKTHLYKISQELFGTGITEHIGNLRIERAKILLLENPEAYIKEICFSCGFNNYDYFITKFRRITGMSPAKFRSTERKNYTDKSV